MAEIRKVAVVGAGTMGNGIVHVFAQHGYDVTMIDVRPEALEAARTTISGNLDRQVKKGALTQEDRDAALGRIRTAASLAKGVAGADLVVGAATENRALNFRIFEKMDAAAPPHAILASNTSSISITEIAARTSRPGQVIGMHFMNPVPVMKLVEIIRGLATSEATTRAVVATSEALGKTVAEANDYPGFVANRILMPMINEAVYCLMEGVATREAIDTVMKLGMNHPMGPLALADLIGLDTIRAIGISMYEEFKEPLYSPPPLLDRMVDAGLLGKKSGHGFYPY